MKDVQINDLQQISFFKEVPETQLQWLIDNSSHYVLKAGEFLAKPDEPLTGTHIIISGKIELYRIQANNKLSISELPAGTITGILPFSRGKISIAFTQCMVDSQIMTFPKEKLKELIIHYYELTQALVVVMTSRVREFTELEQQNEKMMALGKLSAGLAHELNNPAAAIVRGSASLKKHLQLEPEGFKKLISIQLSSESIDTLSNKMFEALGRKERPVLTMMQRSEKEDEISDWLYDQNIQDGMDIAENFVEFGFETKDLEEFKSCLPDNALEPVLNWINTNFTTERMVSEIQEASRRIAELIGSVKTFTHMDRGGDKDLVDIHTGIRNTLVMLNHKIKKAGIELSEEFEENLPHITGKEGELNQVWTNLIDNASDALEGQPNPKLTIKTWKENEFVKIAVIDNGAGVPKDIKSKIFDPFFTTKQIGKGTGLGLDVVNRIVKQHQGSVTLSSEPGHTEFLVCFPIN
ncbi:Adaptive-response sensory-kinase SasA [Dyadobacter sp. CECT 9275]|uniref:histidine kinase n=1 Tax=Dyadobacter helix TaxID=2822344 RepID=A0A916NL50_9BACT|nr:ATP-binding protein [Dyadobacter sp. CECT 9275]CAG4999024.1 Adaptive-response sensory-kinase SasA [Dyadobacter sp. CECT 9275]